jgi:hypothetical protein
MKESFYFFFKKKRCSFLKNRMPGAKNQETFVT